MVFKPYPEFKVKQDLCEIGKRMYQKEFISGTDGNLSVRVSENEIWTTPTGVSKGDLTPDMLVKVNLQGEVIGGKLKPSSEIKMHLKVYEERPEVRAVVHAHPLYSTAFAIAGLPLDKSLMAEAVVFLGTVPIAEYGTPSTKEVPDAVGKYVKDYNALLLEHHGALTWGEDLYNAYYKLESLEFFAKITFITKQLGGDRTLDCDKVSELVQIRNSLGIGGVVPKCTIKGAPAEQKSPKPEETTAKDQDIQSIIEAVTAAVLKKLEP